MSGPVRVQLKRTKGWRMPANTVVVTRGPGKKWGNPFKVGDIVHRGPAYSGRAEVVRDVPHALRLYRKWLFNLRSAAELHTLRGKNLACFCPLDQPCHADVLLELANPIEPSAILDPSTQAADTLVPAASGIVPSTPDARGGDLLKRSP